MVRGTGRGQFEFFERGLFGFLFDQRCHTAAVEATDTRGARPSATKQIRMRASAHKIQLIAFKLVDQQKVATDMAFPVVGPFAF